MEKILLIEDEPGVASFIKKGLEEEGYNVALAYDGRTGLELLAQDPPQMVILDIILPYMSGLEVCQHIRRKGHIEIPVLMLTALGSTDNVVDGLDSGADDYLRKPFKLKELLARVRALLRRKNHHEDHQEKAFLEIADLRLDRDTRTANRAGHEIKLTSTEYRLLEYFLKNQRRVLSRIDILENVWDINFDMGTNVVDVYVNYLRNKKEKGIGHRLIHTVIGMGYIIKENGQ